MSYKIELAMAAPSHYATLLNSGLKADDLSLLRLAACGGEPVSYELAAAISKTLEKAGAICPWVSLGYGMSELGPTVFTSNNKSNIHNKVGGIISDVEVRIVDDDGKILGENEKGHLEVKSPYRMKGYFKQPELTKAFFTVDGFAKTGDIAMRDENGYYDVLGRATDYIIAPDGVKVYLFDIERVVYKDSTVAECEVIGLEVNGKSIPIVHIVLNTEYLGKDTEVILRVHKLCKEYLTESEIPQGYKIREAFGTNPISTKRDYQALMVEREGFYAIEGDEVREVMF
jgi:acyl-coenzyme A synthetase/AMP-(fatty) acid ligase